MQPSGTTSFRLKLGVISLVVLAVGIFFSRRRRRMERLIDVISEFKQGTVHMKNPDHVEEVINQLIKGGKSKLQVVSDWDATLTKYMHNGVAVATSYAILDEFQKMDPSHKQKYIDIRDHYQKIEYSPDLTHEEKLPYMIEWWDSAHKVLLDLKVKSSDIPDMVSGSNAVLRNGCETMFEVLHGCRIPLVIFSAGLGDIIKEIIRQRATLYDNIKIISNHMKYGEEGYCIGFKGNTIHSLNKNEAALSHANGLFRELSNRNNILLLGDHLGDIHMADGVPSLQHILRIGYLNREVERNLQQYMEDFDVVLVENETLDLPNALLQKIL